MKTISQKDLYHVQLVGVKQRRNLHIVIELYCQINHVYKGPVTLSGSSIPNKQNAGWESCTICNRGVFPNTLSGESQEEDR